MDKLDIRISITAFCPQFALPCIGRVAYPDPTSCSHYYYCTDRGEVERISCKKSVTNNKVRIIKGAALCVTPAQSTCEDSFPGEQCSAVDNFLPDEYCQVHAPAEMSWTYPDPIHCDGFYKYTPSRRLPLDGAGIVVEHRLCPRPNVYSPDNMECLSPDKPGDVLCGGKWIRHNQECRPVKPKTRWHPTSRDNPTITPPVTKAAESPKKNVTTYVKAAPVPAYTIIPVLIAIASALIILTICATFGYIIYHRKRKESQQRQILPPETTDHGGNNGDAFNTPPLAELNDYAAIEEVFGNTIERQRLFQGDSYLPAYSSDPRHLVVTDNGRALSEKNSQIPRHVNLHMSVPDGYAEGPALPPRPTSPPTQPIAPVRRTRPKDVRDRQREAPKARESFGLFTNEKGSQKKGSVNMTWLEALNSTMPPESESSDEYEAIEFKSNGKAGKYILPTLKRYNDIDTEEYMTPVIARKSLPEPIVIIPKRESDNLPNADLTNISPVKNDGVLSSECSNLRDKEEVSKCDSNESEPKSPRTALSDLKDLLFTSDQETPYGTLSSNSTGAYEYIPEGKDDKYPKIGFTGGRGSWEVSGSWARINHVSNSPAVLPETLESDVSYSKPIKISKEINSTADPTHSIAKDTLSTETKNCQQINEELTESTLTDSTAEHVPSVVKDLTEGNGSSNEIRDSLLNEISEPSETNLTVTDSAKLHQCDDNLDSGESSAGSDTTTVDVSVKVADNEVKVADNGVNLDGNPSCPKPTPRVGYEILVKTNCTTDFRLYQCIGESTDSSDSDDREYPPGQSPNDSLKTHEYYVLDKHHNSDDTIESKGKSRETLLDEDKKLYRQSCKF